MNAKSLPTKIGTKTLAGLKIGIHVLNQDQEPSGGLNINKALEGIGVKSWIGVAVSAGPVGLTIAKFQVHELLAELAKDPDNLAEINKLLDVG